MTSIAVQAFQGRYGRAYLFNGVYECLCDLEMSGNFAAGLSNNVSAGRTSKSGPRKSVF